jgi:protein-L-isoaspartate(D-aspartate) O-methyltransferase
MDADAPRRMVDEQLRTRGIEDPRVLDAMQAVPRHLFAPAEDADRAYDDRPLPIGHGQTISQPFIVALMTQALLDRPRNRVLEIGTGSGYQAAVLARLVKRVYTIERIQPLIERAEARFRAMKLRNIRVKYDDGNVGWPEQAPFDGILVTAAARTVPDALVAQLSETGRMVIPVGGSDTQELKIIDHTPDGPREQTIELVRFVPLLRGTA